ncbi:MAG: hypothetical protein IH624_15980 [Phycisphaerae bacterium]|nr:hypothetical protein [Phycisphaerae bacterium]
MTMQKNFKIVTWFISIGLAVGVGSLSALLVMAFIPSPGTSLDAVLLLMVSGGFACAAFGVVWLLYYVFKHMDMQSKTSPAVPASARGA